MKTASVASLALLVSLANAQYTVEILHSGLVPAASSYGAGAGGGQQVGHTNLFLAGPSHALLWSGTANSLVDLHPAGWDASYAMATDGVRQVGWRERHTGQAGQFATMWSGSAKGWVDLHAKAYFETIALGVSGNVQVGGGAYAPFPNHSHALLWNGSAASMTVLHPKHHERSLVRATDGIQQAGFAGTITDPRAAVWQGTVESFVDLHPDGYNWSEAYAVSSGVQAGIAVFAGNGHAALWTGSKGSFVDLNPGPNNEWGSQAFATNASQQVGRARTLGGHMHAALWSGTPGSYVNLHGFLSAEYTGVGAFSEATGIDEQGNIVGWAIHVPTGAAHAVLWQPVPEPKTLLMTVALLAVLLTRRRNTVRERRNRFLTVLGGAVKEEQSAQAYFDNCIDSRSYSARGRLLGRSHHFRRWRLGR